MRTRALTGLTATVVVAIVAPVSAWSASAKPGTTPAKAAATLASTVRIVDPEIVAAAKADLAEQTRLARPAGIDAAKANLEIARAGLGVDRATCRGVKAAPGGFVSFACTVRLSDDLGIEAKALGSWRRLPAGTWRWSATAVEKLGGYPHVGSPPLITCKCKHEDY